MERNGAMYQRRITATGMLALTITVGACGREPAQPAPPTVDLQAERTAQAERRREQELSQLDDRVAALERSYDEKSAGIPQGTSGKAASGRLHEDVKSDVADVKDAVKDLRSTTAENWWDRHEAAVKKAADEVESDVKAFSATKMLPAPTKPAQVADGSGQAVSTAPFTSKRDKFVADMRLRFAAMNKVLDNVKATGPRKTALDDLRARVNKLDDDMDRLRTASADDWWDLSKTRVSDYIDRVEKSVARLDNLKR
jgi:hypothetical protein